MIHFRTRTVINDQITSEQCVSGGITTDTANTVLLVGNSWRSDVDLTEISNWLLTAVLQGPALDGPGIAVKVVAESDNFKVTFCDDGPYCTLSKDG